MPTVYTRYIQWVYGTGTDNIHGGLYTFKDKTLKSGKTYYYELEVVFEDGTSEWRKVRSVKMK